MACKKLLVILLDHHSHQCFVYIQALDIALSVFSKNNLTSSYNLFWLPLTRTQY
jgi:hypothetical protein